MISNWLNLRLATAALAGSMAMAVTALVEASPSPTCVVQDDGECLTACWKYYACYESYGSACRVANRLREQGFQTRITDDGDYYEVWYRQPRPGEPLA
jgi:hypothetical protein